MVPPSGKPSTWRNTEKGYGWGSILLHWLSVPLVLFLLGSGIYMVTLSYYDPLYHPLPQWHKEAGVMLALLTALRLVKLLVDKSPPLLAMPKWQHRLARLVHGLLYAGMVILMGSGYAFTTAEGHPIDVFGWFSIPAISTWSVDTVEWLGWLHQWVAYALGVLIVLHAGAALHHHFRLRDNTLRRILFPQR